MDITKLPGNSWYKFIESIPADLQVDTDLFEHLWSLHPHELGEVKIFGKITKTPRWQQSYGRDYKFSGMNHHALPIEDPYLIKLLEWVKKDSGIEYNQVLINWYQDGNHYIGKHSDDERDLVSGDPIYSFSFGQERDFRITNKPKSEFQISPIKIKLPSNSLIIMGGDMQKHYHHEVPKRALSTCPLRRINITVRHFS